MTDFSDAAEKLQASITANKASLQVYADSSELARALGTLTGISMALTEWAKSEIALTALTAQSEEEFVTRTNQESITLLKRDAARIIALTGELKGTLAAIAARAKN